MDIRGKTLMVLGGWGLVGSAVCRKLMEHKPRRLVVTSLFQHEADEAVADLKKEYPRAGKNFFVPWSGNIFVRHSLKDMPRETMLADKRYRAMLMDDMVGEMTEDILRRSALFQLLSKFKPDIVIDCINSATAIAYQDIFQSMRTVLQRLQKKEQNNLEDAVERLICTQYMPQLIRHVQILYQSLKHAGTKMYVKIGTSGTGGMGLNIPYTHSEERPSRVLLSKSSVAGAHTLLLFLMGRTPDGPIIKEVKPTGLIGWKKIGYGEIRKRKQPIPLVDCTPKEAVRLNGDLEIRMLRVGRPLGKNLKSVFIDTGENGLFSKGEFEAITTPGQMEFVTPEEIAESVIFEIRGGNTGHDIINALDNATLEPTYRAGYLFHNAMKNLERLEKKHRIDSVAFEMLGPPRVSKLLYEAYLLKLAYRDMRAVSRARPAAMVKKLHALIVRNRELRAQIISIGIPILLPDGKSLLRGPEIKIPPFHGENRLKLTRSHIDAWARDGWVDLRAANMRVWKHRCATLVREIAAIPKDETGSRFMRTPDYWTRFPEIDPGKMVGWIFSVEEHGQRMKS